MLRAVSNYLNTGRIELLNMDFEQALIGCKHSSFVYFDPPYYPVSDSSNFTGYTVNGFTKEDQIRLKNLCDKLTDKGVRWLLSIHRRLLLLVYITAKNIILIMSRQTDQLAAILMQEEK